MADDPTTTGPEFNPAKLAEGLRTLMGAHVTEHSPFRCELKGDLVFTVADGRLTITLDVEGGGEQGEPVKATMDFPLERFGATEMLNAFLRGVKRNFLNSLRDALTAETFLHAADVTNAMLGLMEIEDIDRPEIIRRHVEDTAKRLEVNLRELPERPKGATWSKIALRNAVANVAGQLALRGVTGRALTLEAVNKELRVAFPEAAPQNGEALRKQLDERGLSWRQIKTAAQKYARYKKAEAERRGISPLTPAGPDPENGEAADPNFSGK